jgi:ERCC4-type nuclease
MNDLKILIDDREDSSTIKIIDEYFSGICSVSHNEDGDVLIKRQDLSDIMIELKSVSDFVSSFNSRHIQDQALRMKEKYDFCYIIIYGKLDDINYKYQNFTRKQYYSNIASLSVRYKVPVLQCETKKSMPLLIESIINTVNKNTEPIEPPIVQKKDASSKIQVLLGIDYVGKKTAKLLLKEFKTPLGVLQATDEELLNIKGIGQKTVNGINKVR